MAKILGYLFAVVGLAGLAVSTVPQLRTFIPAQIPKYLTDLPLLIGALALTVVGIFMLVKGGGRGKQPAEVPIYEGKNVVGFRRMGK